MLANGKKIGIMHVCVQPYPITVQCTVYSVHLLPYHCTVYNSYPITVQCTYLTLSLYCTSFTLSLYLYISYPITVISVLYISYPITVQCTSLALSLYSVHLLPYH